MAATNSRWQCSNCGIWHIGPAMVWETAAPDLWPHDESDPERRGLLLTSDRCEVEIRGTKFHFVRGNLEIPVRDGPSPFVWGVWVSLSEANYARMGDLWDSEGRESEPPYFGWLSSSLTPHYPSARSLKTNLHTKPVGERPTIELEPTGHPLATEQRDGITMARVRQIAEAMMHLPLAQS